MHKHQTKTKDVNISTANEENEVKTKSNKSWTKKDTNFLMNSDLPTAQIAKKLNRTVPACSMRKSNIKKKIAAGKINHPRAGRPVVVKTLGPATPVLVSQTYSYRGRHQIVTLNKLSWLSQKLLGVKLAA